MPRETIRTHDAELYVGWPTTEADVERDRSVQVGARFGDSVAWVTLTSPDEVADFRRTLQRASRAVWPTVEPGPLLRGGLKPAVPPPNLLLAGYVGDNEGDLPPGMSLFGPVATGLVTPAPTDEPA